jgi:hypothetical protein
MAATRDAMKKLLANAKGFRPKFPIPLPLKPRLASVTAHQEVPLFPAKYSVEPVPHPHPFERVLVLATPEGLILRPDIPEPESGIKITYEKNCKIEVINDKSVLIGSAWGESFVIFGIVGIVRLFTGEYIRRVITCGFGRLMVDLKTHTYSLSLKGQISGTVSASIEGRACLIPMLYSPGTSSPRFWDQARHFHTFRLRASQTRDLYCYETL